MKTAADWLKQGLSNPWWPFVTDAMAGEIHEAACRRLKIIGRMR